MDAEDALRSRPVLPWGEAPTSLRRLPENVRKSLFCKGKL